MKTTTKTSGWRVCVALMTGIAAVTLGLMALVSPTPILLSLCGVAALANMVAWQAV